MANILKNITNRQYALPFALVTLLFFLWGFARSILDVLNKHFQETMDISIAESAWIQVTTYMAYFLMAIPAGVFINRFGYKRGVVTGLALFAAGAFLFVPAAEMNVIYGFLGALFVLSCGLAFLETSANPYATELGPRESATSRLNLSQTFNGLGCSLAPVAVGSYLFTGGEVEMPYVIMGSVVLLTAVTFSMCKLPEVKIEGEEENAESTYVKSLNEGKKGNLARVMSNGMFLFGFAALLAYEVGEISINSYFLQFTTGQGWLTKMEASAILSGALFIFMAGRFIGSWVMLKVDAAKVLMVCGVCTVVCMGVVLCNMGKVSLYALVANYFFESIMFPTIFALTLRDMGELKKTASSVLMMTPVGGCAFLIIGMVADKVGLVAPFAIPLIGFMIVAAFGWKELRGSDVETTI